MGYIIDLFILLRELVKLAFVVLTSPFAIIASALLFGSYQF